MGRKMLVAPVTLLVSGVLNGSRGPLLYPPDEVGKFVDAWNNMPTIVYHPKDGPTGRTPAIINKQGIGFLFNVAYSAGKLTGEVWIDEEVANRVDNRIVSMLDRGEVIEVSTGLHTDNEPVPDGTTHNGIAYTHIARNYRPDHLAILPDQKGACSVRDGCGILNAETETTNVTEPQSILEKIKSLIMPSTENVIPPVVDEPPKVFSAILGNAKPTEKCDCKGECEYCKAGEIVANASGMSLTELQNKIYDAFYKLYPRTYSSGSDAPVSIPFVADVYDKYFICQKENGELYRHDYVVKDGEVEIDANAKEVKRVTTYEATENESADSENDTGDVTETEGEPMASPVSNQEGIDAMALKAEEKKTIIDNLIAWNCECGKASNGPKPWAETDRETLNAMKDEKLMSMDECRKAMTKNELVANAAKDHLVISADGTVTPKEVPVANAAAPKPMTEAEWFASAPPVVLKLVENAKSVENREKNDIVTRLVANVAETERQAIADRFMQKSVEDLRDLDKLIPRKVENSGSRWMQPDYSGAAAPVSNAKPEDKVEPLYSPPMQW